MKTRTKAALVDVDEEEGVAGVEDEEKRGVGETGREQEDDNRGTRVWTETARGRGR